jgi:hypothetical protein
MSKALVFARLAALVSCFAAAANATGTWVARTGSQSQPGDAVVGGWGATGLLEYICRGSYGGGVHPGRLLSGSNWNGFEYVFWSSCNIGYGGQEIPLTTYEALTTTWQAVTDPNAALPANAVVFGHDAPQADGSLPPLYACRAHDSTGVRPGKTRPGFGGCNVAESGREVTVTTYDLLIYTFPLAQIPVSSTAPRPNDVLVGGGGVTGGSLWICAGQFQGGVHPGSLDVNGVCHFGFGGLEQTATAAQGYTALTPRWNIVSAGLVFPTGNEADGTPLYTCHANDPAGTAAVFTGKFQKGFNGCHYGAGGQEVIATSNWLLLDIPVFIVKP